MALNKIDGDLLVTGTVTILVGLNLDRTMITNAMVVSSAGIDASKLDHYETVGAFLSGTAASKTILAWYAPTAGTLRSTFHAGSVTPCSGSATVTVDLKKNGTSVLSGGTPITLDSGNSARVAEEGVATTTSVAAGDCLEVVLSVTVPGSDTAASDVFASFGIDYTYPT